ncbi:MAG: cytochrome c biogenesis protein ResB [Syntrophobacteria bacterium]
MERTRAFATRIYDFLASVRLSLFLFGALAVTSIFGTIIPQDATFEQRLNQYGPRLNRLIELLDLGDMYHSWWFQLLLTLLAANLIICSVRRLPKTLKSLKAGRNLMGPARLQKMHSKAEIHLSLPPSEIQTKLASILDRRFSSCLWREQQGNWQAVAQKGRVGRLGVYFVHLSVLIILVGALIGSLFGFRGFVTIAENEAVEQINLRGKRAAVSLDFQVRCDKFSVDFYETGAPREFRSEISILEKGKVIMQAPVRVNHPVTYRGITFYQSTYGIEPSAITIRFKDLKSGGSQRLEVPFRQTVTIPGTRDRMVVMDFAENVGNFGPAFFVGLAPENEKPASAWIIANQPDFHGNRIGDFGISVLDYLKHYYTGLQVKKDPGVWVIYLGFCLILVSLIVALYISHRRVWLVLRPGSSGSRVLLAGNASKHPLAFQRELEQLIQEISALNQNGTFHD